MLSMPGTSYKCGLISIPVALRQYQHADAVFNALELRDHRVAAEAAGGLAVVADASDGAWVFLIEANDKK